MSSPTRMPAKMKFFFSRVFPWAFIISGALILYFSARAVHRAKESLTWPVATGRIQKSSVEDHSGGKHSPNAYRAKVLYTFTVDGRTYGGDTVAFCDYGGEPCYAQGIVNQYPENKVVSVRYHPNDPSICVLEPGLNGQTKAWWQFGCGLLFFVVGTLMAVLLPMAMKKQSNAS